jgi:acyl dehydratase
MGHSSYASLAARTGQEIGLSSWIEIDQSRIDRFAEVSGDDGFIHVDPVAAAATPFGGTIAHGLLLLSLTGAMGKEVLPTITDRAYLLNYGYDKVRLLSPVPARSRIRGRYRLNETVERSTRERLMRYAVTVEREGGERPALVADWLLMVVLK